MCKGEISPSSNLLEGTGDDEVCVIHGYKISCKLAWEVVFVIQIFPVDVRIWIFCFL